MMISDRTIIEIWCDFTVDPLDNGNTEVKKSLIGAFEPTGVYDDVEKTLQLKFDVYDVEQGHLKLVGTVDSLEDYLQQLWDSINSQGSVKGCSIPSKEELIKAVKTSHSYRSNFFVASAAKQKKNDKAI